MGEVEDGGEMIWAEYGKGEPRAFLSRMLSTLAIDISFKDFCVAPY